MISIRYFNIISLLVICGAVYSQDFHFSGFMQNMIYTNPGYTALPNAAGAGLTYRNQWPGIPASFITYGANVVIPVQSLNSGLGFFVMKDIQGSGVINLTSVGLEYGYLIKLNRNWQIGAGLSASINIKRFDASEMVLRSDILNELGYSYGTLPYESYIRNYLDFSVGFIARNQKSLSFGVSASHLTRPPDNESVLMKSRLPIKYTAFISGQVGEDRNSNLVLEPAAFYSMQKENTELIWGTSVNMRSKFSLGGWIRQNQKFNFDALIVSAGISLEKYNINYCYDVNLKKINFLSTKMAAHEVTFLYRFEYKDERRVKRFKKSECPAY